MSEAFWPYVGPALITLSVAGGPVLLVLIVLRYRRSVAELRHRTALELAQRGVTVPPELLVDLGPGRRYSDLRNGLVLIGIGLGAIAFAFTLPHHPTWGIGLIPLFAGLGFLATWLVSRPGSSSSDV